MDGQDVTEVDDLVVLGNAVPEKIRDGRKTVCVAGYSRRLGLIRVYPTRPDSPVKWWNELGVPLVRNPMDTRRESWKIPGSKAEWDRLDDKIENHGPIKKNHRRELWSKICERHQVGCVSDLNDGKLSLGVVRPTILSYRLEKRPT